MDRRSPEEMAVLAHDKLSKKEVDYLTVSYKIAIETVGSIEELEKVGFKIMKDLIEKYNNATALVILEATYSYLREYLFAEIEKKEETDAKNI